MLMNVFDNAWGRNIRSMNFFFPRIDSRTDDRNLVRSNSSLGPTVMNFGRVIGGHGTSRFVRVEADPGELELYIYDDDDMMNLEYKAVEGRRPGLRSRIGKNVSAQKTGKILKPEASSRTLSDGCKRAKNKILDPRGHFIRSWSKIFLVACLFSIFVDPLFFYLQIIRKELCIDIAVSLKTILTIIRSVADVFYVIQIYIRFHTAYVAPSSRVLGQGDLVTDSPKIALSYFQKGFWLDLIAALPLPQVLAWVVFPHLEGSAVTKTKNIWFVLLLQYLPRIYLVFPLSSQILETAGVVTEKAWAAAAYNLLLFMLASHASGAVWYLLSMERIEDCWKKTCSLEKQFCQNRFFDCRMVRDPQRVGWFKISNVTNQCNPSNSLYPFGIYSNAVTYNVQGLAFLRKYFYCLWWGLKNVSTLGQSFTTSIDVGENVFVLILVTLGLILLALLIGNVQRYLQSTTMRLEEWKIKRTDTEHWMHHRHLPSDLRQIVRKYDLYKWLATKGVDEESLINVLPVDLQRKIKRHICFDLLRRVPLFEQMEETMLDAICERLEPALCTKGMFLLREGDPVNQMFFIIRGKLDSYTTNGGRSGFFNLSCIGPGDFCGDELLTWALDPHLNVNLPSSTRTVKVISEVEAFALKAEDLRFVASQFKKLHSRQIKYKFRFYSQQWRTWAACTIQAAWRRHKRLKEMIKMGLRGPGLPQSVSLWSTYAESMVASTRRNNKYEQSTSLEKPDEPDFLVD